MGPASGSPGALVPGPARRRAGRIGSRGAPARGTRRGTWRSAARMSRIPWARAGSRMRPLARSTSVGLREGLRRPFFETVGPWPYSSTATVSLKTRTLSWTSLRLRALRSRTSASRPRRAHSSKTSVVRVPASSRRVMRSAAGWSVTSTTAPNSDSSDYRWRCASYASLSGADKDRQLTRTPPRGGGRAGPGDCRAARACPRHPSDGSQRRGSRRCGRGTRGTRVRAGSHRRPAAGAVLPGRRDRGIPRRRGSREGRVGPRGGTAGTADRSGSTSRPSESRETLIDLEDRVRALDGSLDVVQAPGGGVRIGVEIPCE